MPLTIIALWALFALLPALLLLRHATRANEPTFPWVFLTLVLGPIGLAGWLLSRAADRIATAHPRH